MGARLVRVRVEEVASRVELLRNHARDAEHCDAAHNKLLATEVALGREAEGVKAYVEIKLSRRVLLRLNHGLHAINATPARPRGGVNSSPLDRARTAASSPRNDLVKNCRVHPTHWLISAQSLGKRLRKTTVLAGDAFGFIGNRMLEPYGRECLALLRHRDVGVADVDGALRDFGMAMGAFAES